MTGRMEFNVFAHLMPMTYVSKFRRLTMQPKVSHPFSVPVPLLPSRLP